MVKIKKTLGQKGQAITEAVLMMVVFMGITFMVANFFKDEEVLKQLVKTPWQSLSGVLENGVWGTPQRTASQHPNTHMRHVSNEGENPR